MDPLYILQRLSTVFGPSTCEDEVVAAIRQIMGDSYQYYETPHKHLLVVPPFTRTPKKTIFLQAHTDELGFRPFRYQKDGFIELTPIGSIPDTVANHQLRFAPSGTHGILIIEKDDRRSKFYVDIGAKNAEEAEAMVPLYSNGAYVGTFQTSASLLAGKSFDDRAGCAAILSVLGNAQAQNDTRVVGVFTAREETGNWPIPELVRCCEKRELLPDLIINIDACPGGPTPDNKSPEAYSDKGVVLVHTDRYYACEASLCRFMVDVARRKQIPHQQISVRTGGGEMGQMACSFGVTGYSLTVPVRYMHDPHSVMSKIDYEALIAMLHAIVENWGGR